MSDMSQVIIPKSDQLNSDDLIAGPITVKITGVTIRAGGEQPISVSYDGDNGKPYKPCKSMCRVMVTAWGADSKQYTGRSLTLYRDPTVKWAGLDVGGIRISHMTDIEAPLTMALTMTKQSRKPFTVKPLKESAGTQGKHAAELPADALAPASPADQDPTIDDKQLSTITDLLNELGVPEAEFLAFGDLQASKDLPARLFTKACAWIKKQAKA